ncbi:MAG TPA: hypothetical protein VFD29_10110 [Gillisia sp.]|nr:hypothetical protein [Gillisia sp.]
MSNKIIVWKDIQSDSNGFVDTIRFNEEMSGTVTLKNTIRSIKKQTVELDFGYAKHLMVVLNNDVLFNQDMDTKDEEGRVFMEDESLELNLSKGKNELFFVLTGDAENKHNWGFIARFRNPNGISIE